MITVAKTDTKPVGNKPICLHNIILGPDLYDVIAQCCSTGLLLSKCMEWKMSGELLNISVLVLQPTLYLLQIL